LENGEMPPPKIAQKQVGWLLLILIRNLSAETKIIGSVTQK
jgi:hypothetical protein